MNIIFLLDRKGCFVWRFLFMLFSFFFFSDDCVSKVYRCLAGNKIVYSSSHYGHCVELPESSSHVGFVSVTHGEKKFFTSSRELKTPQKILKREWEREKRAINDLKEGLSLAGHFSEKDRQDMKNQILLHEKNMREIEKEWH